MIVDQPIVIYLGAGNVLHAGRQLLRVLFRDRLSSAVDVANRLGTTFHLWWLIVLVGLIFLWSDDVG